MFNKVVLKEISALTTEHNNFASEYYLNKTLCIVTNDASIHEIESIVNDFNRGLVFFERKTNRLFCQDDLIPSSLENVYKFLKQEFNSPRNYNILGENDRKEFWFETRNKIRLALPRKFTNRIDLINQVFYFGDSDVHLELPTLQDLVQCGVLTECFDYQTFEVNYPNRPSRISVNNIQKFFKSKGFNVTEEAILHNFKGYLRGFKCGYRDEKNGYHLFTPCHLNNLSFCLTSLSDLTDWQITYQC